jgi:hypothetical protein
VHWRRQNQSSLASIHNKHSHNTAGRITHHCGQVHEQAIIRNINTHYTLNTNIRCWLIQTHKCLDRSTCKRFELWMWKYSSFHQRTVLNTWRWPHWSKHIVWYDVKKLLIEITFSVFMERRSVHKTSELVTFSYKLRATGCYNIFLRKPKKKRSV